MTFTKHGYHIPGSPNDTTTIPTFRIDCEGPLLCAECHADIYVWRKTNEPNINNPNSGPGYYEFIHPTKATTHIAYVRENGEVYIPEADVTEEDFLLASARGRTHRLVRVDDVDTL